MAIFLLKNRSEDLETGHKDPYEQSLDEIRFAPIMDYHCINLEGIAETLGDSSGYDGIIVTSQRAVDSLKLALPTVPVEVLTKPVYTVGPTTAKRLSNLGFTDVIGAESGTGSVLASSMLETLPQSSRLVFLAGEIHRPLLPKKLEGAGHSVATTIVYRTTPNSQVGGLLKENAHAGDWIVFFSPSHTQQALDFVRESTVPLNIAAIGPTTRDYLLENGFPVHAVAPEPDAEGLKMALSEFEKSRN